MRNSAVNYSLFKKNRGIKKGQKVTSEVTKDPNVQGDDTYVTLYHDPKAGNGDAQEVSTFSLPW